jgi:hypothetical protein
MSYSNVFTMLVTQYPLTSLVSDSASYTPGTTSLLDIIPCPLELVGSRTMFSVFVFNVSL